MIYKYTRCESVIAKIMADADMDGTYLRVTDMREWIFEAVNKIGAPMLYVEKESGVGGCPILKIKDYQVPIPDDLEHLSTVGYSKAEKGPWSPARTNNSSFKGNSTDKHCCCCDQDEDLGDRPIPYKPATHRSQLYNTTDIKLVGELLNGAQEEPQFFIKPGWIVLNKKEGFIKLSYKAIATDDRGYPLIPDMESYREAIYWYVMMKIAFPKFMAGTLSKGVKNLTNVYFYIQQQWNFYRNQAYAEAMMPTESDMRSIKNEWNKLVPDYNADTMFFKSEGEEQLNYNDYYYGY